MPDRSGALHQLCESHRRCHASPRIPFPATSVYRFEHRDATEILPVCNDVAAKTLCEIPRGRVPISAGMTNCRSLNRYIEFSPESVQGEGPGAELVRAIRKIAQITRRLVEIDKEVVNLEQSDYFKLNVKVEQGKAEGRDVLREMAEDLDLKITASRERLRDSTQKQGRSWSTNTEKTI